VQPVRAPPICATAAACTSPLPAVIAPPLWLIEPAICSVPVPLEVSTPPETFRSPPTAVVELARRKPPLETIRLPAVVMAPPWPLKVPPFTVIGNITVPAWKVPFPALKVPDENVAVVAENGPPPPVDAVADVDDTLRVPPMVVPAEVDPLKTPLEATTRSPATQTAPLPAVIVPPFTCSESVTVMPPEPVLNVPPDTTAD
jgi:hypothetical protein